MLDDDVPYLHNYIWRSVITPPDLQRQCVVVFGVRKLVSREIRERVDAATWGAVNDQVENAFRSIGTSWELL